MNPIIKLIHRLERVEVLDTVAQPVAAAARKLFEPAPVSKALGGAYVGHAVHPILVQIPVGAWTMSALFDALPGKRFRSASNVLIGVGILVVPAASATGLHDWSHTSGAPSRVGVVHASFNAVAVGFYTASLLARLKGDRARGTLLGLAGFSAMGVGGALGGHMAYAQAVNVNRTAWHEGPARWTSVLDEGDLPVNQPLVVTVNDVEVLLYRTGRRLFALDNACSHSGAPLDEGTIAGGRVTCPDYGCTFNLVDGSVADGPASNPQPHYDVRVHQGRLEIKVAA